MTKNTGKFWHLRWSYSPSGSSYYITDLPPGNIRELSSPSEEHALAFDDEKVAWGAALVLQALFNVQVSTVQRWNGFASPEPHEVLR